MRPKAKKQNKISNNFHVVTSRNEQTTFKLPLSHLDS